jgi:hypothetical protein
MEMERGRDDPRTRPERFAADMFLYLAKRKRISIEPIAASFAFAIDGQEWRRRLTEVGVPPGTGWDQALALVSYLPVPFEARLRVHADAQTKGTQEEFPGEYDRYLNADTWIWVKKRPDLDDREVYLLITTAVAHIIPWVLERKPLHAAIAAPDKNAAYLLDDFRREQGEEFLKKYGL